MENKEEKKGLNISVKSFITAIAIIFGLMVLSYVLTFIIPGGELPFWKWILSPVLVFTAEGSGLLIAVVAFLLVIGGIFNALYGCGLMKYMLDFISHKYANRKYKLMAVVMFFFMVLGALIGSFEEVVPFVPIVVGLAIKLGWDNLTGVGMSLLAVGCGFASGVFNPFTVGIAQTLAGLPMFSGAWLRALSFVCIYALLYFFVSKYAKKIENKEASLVDVADFKYDANMAKGLKVFAVIIGIGIAVILSSSFITFLQDLTLPIVALVFLIAGLSASIVCGLKGKALLSMFVKGLTSMLPAVLMIAMASSIKYILETAGVLPVILDKLIEAASGMPQWLVVLFIYLIVLIMNFFIASGSAKAVMLMPLIVPLAAASNISAQLCVVAFAFGDGFSNVFYPTNPALLISLGLTDTNYVKWAKWSGKFQFANLILTSALLLLGFALGY